MDERDNLYGSSSQQPYIPKHEKPASESSYNSYGSSQHSYGQQQSSGYKPRSNGYGQPSSNSYGSPQQGYGQPQQQPVAGYGYGA